VRRLVLALAITGAFIGVEAVAGLIANSLALLTDAAHNLTDALALVLSWHALALASRPPSGRRTYGYHRAGILIALFNSTTLALMALGIFYEAYRRFVSPPTVNADLLIGVGIVAFVVNAGTALIVRRGSEGDLNMRSAFVHLAGDAISTLGAVLAGVAIKLTGWEWLDPLVSVLIGGLILWSGWKIIRETVTILMEGTPAGLDMRLLVRDLLSVEGVQGVHDVHAWSITGSLRAFSAHVLTKDMSISAGAGIQRQINALLREKYQIGHATLQLECQGCEPDLLYCDLVPADDHEHAEPVPG
jgi:cobalt-zinc-cadmium efflux system protein